MRLPPKLPLIGRNKGLHDWLNCLREAVASMQIQVPHNIQRVQTAQGVILQGNLGGEKPVSNGRAVWL